MGIILLIGSCLPSIILGWIIYRKDYLEKEPKKLLFDLFLSGISAIFLTLLISIATEILFSLLFKANSNNLFYTFIYTFLGIALVEEFSKWYFLKKKTWNNVAFNHIYDAIVYAVFVSLGFATIENILYVLQEKTLFVLIIRALTSVPIHAFCGVFMGYYYGMSKQASINNNQVLLDKNMKLSIFVPTLLHGFFDFCLLSGNIYFILIWLIFVITIYIISFKRVKIISKIEQNFINQENILYCMYCGTKVNGKYCSNCGVKIND